MKIEVKTSNGTYYKLSKIESESTITMNDEESFAEIGTWQLPIIRKL